MKKNIQNMLKDKTVLIVGMGKSGIAACGTALDLGARVHIQDTKSPDQIDPRIAEKIKAGQIRGWLGGESPDVSLFDMLILSPGVPTDLPFIREAREAGIEIIGELELAYRIGEGRFVGITGTNGKTTTTTLVGEIFKASGREIYVAGNIGLPVVLEARRASEEGWLVTEISSFQLETTRDFCPQVSAILNITPDHLNRHKTMDNYIAAKAEIFAAQNRDQYCVLNCDDPATWALAKDCPATVVPFSRKEDLNFGACVAEDRIVIRTAEGQTVPICGTEELKIPGSHNLENALAAAAICWFSGIDAAVIGRTMREFEGVEHRIENVGRVNGVRYINDSKGTNPDAAIKAVEAMKENIILIAGGYDKKSDFTDLIRVCRGRVKKMVLLGATANQIRETALKEGLDNVVICRDMDQCVREAAREAVEGDVVLLSPACASWDMYHSYEERGEHFKACVRRLHL